MATLNEIERSWGYDAPETDDDEIDPDTDRWLDDDYVPLENPLHTCTIYTVCDACGKLEYATGSRWWTAANLCQCLPF